MKIIDFANTINKFSHFDFFLWCKYKIVLIMEIETTSTFKHWTKLPFSIGIFLTLESSLQRKPSSIWIVQTSSFLGQIASKCTIRIITSCHWLWIDLRASFKNYTKYWRNKKSDSIYSKSNNETIVSFRWSLINKCLYSNNKNKIDFF